MEETKTIYGSIYIPFKWTGLRYLEQLLNTVEPCDMTYMHLCFCKSFAKTDPIPKRYGATDNKTRYPILE